jgi:NADH-quinone oxidoreductase subunit G
MDQINLTIDGQEIGTQAGTTILEAARGVDIYIPSLCSHPDLPQAEGIQAVKVIYQGERHARGSRKRLWPLCGGG